MTGRPPASGARQLPKSARELLRCVQCGSALSEREGSLRCQSGGCGREYASVDGVPILLGDGTPPTIARNASARPAAKATGALSRLRTKVPTLSRNVAAARNYGRIAQMLADKERPLVLVVGGRVAGEGTDAVLGNPAFEVVESDISLGPRTNLVCDAHWLPFPDGSIDCVIIQAVLEHVLDPSRCADECVRVLSPGGILYAETPFMQQVHAGAFDFTRFTHSGHRRLFREIEEAESGVACGPGMSLAWSYSYFLRSFGRSARSRKALELVARLTAFWLPWFDPYLAGRPGAIDGASAFYLLGVKSGRGVSDDEVIAMYRGAQR